MFGLVAISAGCFVVTLWLGLIVLGLGFLVLSWRLST
jgi:hypothetical protein